VKLLVKDHERGVDDGSDVSLIAFGIVIEAARWRALGGLSSKYATPGKRSSARRGVGIE